ncbi:hypothetical protein BS50DRAFT_569646 [Corynespora cassiicola Philippines]|uniref:Concanavalin A-like lectin/glucanase n=1 Tax=Corynespora cassiicola Philippines TaxID=1448308 RepID=A0A2T2P438_CORCC|nr:hypothetical protein BS50DRAFT_569646 [Corynespora cassiicola Philippines]
MQFSTLLLTVLPATAMALPGLFPIQGPSKPEISKRDSWGGAVSLGPTTSTIIKAVTYLTPGEAPPVQNGMLFLWPGMSNGTGNLVQTTLESWPDNSWCGATKGQWCVRASVFGSFGQIDSEQSAPVSGTQQIKIEYALQSDQDTWRQTVTDVASGRVISSLDHKDGPFMRGYGTGTECNNGCSGTVAEQTYSDTTITLSSADANFGKTIGTSQGATYTGLSSSNGNKVWTIKTIKVPKMQ